MILTAHLYNSLLDSIRKEILARISTKVTTFINYLWWNRNEGRWPRSGSFLAGTVSVTNERWSPPYQRTRLQKCEPIRKEEDSSPRSSDQSSGGRRGSDFPILRGRTRRDHGSKDRGVTRPSESCWLEHPGKSCWRPKWRKSNSIMKTIKVIL